MTACPVSERAFWPSRVIASVRNFAAAVRISREVWGLKIFLVLMLLAAAGGVAVIVAIETAPGNSFGPYSRTLTAFLLVLIAACVISLRLLRTRWREAVRNAWLVVVSSVSAYIACDLALGALLLPAYSSPGIPDSIVHHRYAPNTTSMMVKSEFDITFATNNLGLRGGNVAPHKPAGTCRILVLGDSFTFGDGVADDQTYSVLLERALNEGGAFNVQVMNAGVASYSPILEYLFLKTYGVGWQPDLVVLALDQSDPIQEEYYRSQAHFDKDRAPVSVDGTLNYRHARPSGIVARWVASHMLFGSWVVRAVLRSSPEAKAFENTVERANKGLLLHTLKGHSGDYSMAWRGVFDSIELSFRLSREIGSGFLLVTYPWGHQVSEREWTTGRKQFLPEDFEVSDRNLEEMRSFAGRLGIPFLDLFPAFRSYAGEKRLYHDVDLHWTPEGHALVAAQLAEFLKAGRLKRWCRK